MSMTSTIRLVIYEAQFLASGGYLLNIKSKEHNIMEYYLPFMDNHVAGISSFGDCAIPIDAVESENIPICTMLF